MADPVKTENLGAYHDLFFKLGGTDKTADEFANMTDPTDIARVKNVYEEWVSKHINIGPENADEPKDPIEAENDYFAKREEVLANMPENTDAEKTAKSAAKNSLKADYTKAGWKEVTLSMPMTFNGKKYDMPIKTYNYNPKDPKFEGMTQDDLTAHFTKKYEDENKSKPLNVSEEKTGDENNNDNADKKWQDDKEAFWKEHCGGLGQECGRDAEDKEGLTLDIYKNKEDQAAQKPMARVNYTSKDKATVAGSDGKIADYSVFLGLAKDAKRNNQSINFDGKMSDDFAAKLKLACEEVGIKYQNAPEGKIDANSFADELSPESKKKLEEYNTKSPEPEPAPAPAPEKPKTYEDFLGEMTAKAQAGEVVDVSGYKGMEAINAVAAARVAKVQIKDPKVVLGAEVVKGDDGKDVYKKFDLKDLPKEAIAGLREHNMEASKSYIDKLKERKDNLEPGTEGDDMRKVIEAKQEVLAVMNAYKQKNSIEGAMSEEQMKQFHSSISADKTSDTWKNYAKNQKFLYENQYKNMSDEQKNKAIAQKGADGKTTNTTIGAIIQKRMADYSK